ncbi:serine protease [Bacteroidia bacterium]|nr:serine protease [Bacteroidia bacterium]
MAKARKAVFTVTTYNKEGRNIGTTTGFYISETGEALSAYKPFNGASRAVVTDADGNNLPVASIVGADDLYDVVKFKVSVPKKVEYLPLATDPAPAGTAYLLSYSPTKAPSYKEGSIAETSKLKDAYSYYKFSIPIESGQMNAPWLLPSGEVFALAQEDAAGKKETSYGVSAGYANSLRYSSVDAFNSVYTKIGIRKAWPADAEQAAVSLFLLAGSQDATAYLETLGDFIATFPDSEDGYTSRASLYATRYAELSIARDECLKLASADINIAAKLSKNKAQALYKQAEIIYRVASGDTTITDSNWSLETAAAIIRQAITLEDTPAYRLLEGDISYSQENFPAAYEAYLQAAHSESSPSSYYMAAKSLENIPGSQISDIIALLDSAITKMGTPVPKGAAQYVLERVNHKMQLNLYKEAVEDYDLYYYLSDGKVNDSFYYYREQAKSRAGDNDGAILDIREAIRLNAQVPDYYAEEAAILVRLQKYGEALQSITKALALEPEFASCYRLQGVCYIRQEKKAEACQSFNKAKEMGDPLVARLIREHCQ